MNAKQLKRIIQEELKKINKYNKRPLNEAAKCGCGVGEMDEDCTVIVGDSNHSGTWDCKCCCCILDDASNVGGGPVKMKMKKTMGENRNRNINRRK
tara:strand:+ start:179 stop:466 length:288 start_codon:yes stop_codon:yes gene_type:complete